MTVHARTPEEMYPLSARVREFVYAGLAGLSSLPLFRGSRWNGGFAGTPRKGRGTVIDGAHFLYRDHNTNDSFISLRAVPNGTADPIGAGTTLLTNRLKVGGASGRVASATWHAFTMVRDANRSQVLEPTETLYVVLETTEGGGTLVPGTQLAGLALEIFANEKMI